ncbi:hypothetical protein G7054_g5622 [Neopestalotiopsis clavispora]|nr:hypothetical protein G7054_g5622 [Neopestalotiopsis clavispora]
MTLDTRTLGTFNPDLQEPLLRDTVGRSTGPYEQHMSSPSRKHQHSTTSMQSNLRNSALSREGDHDLEYETTPVTYRAVPEAIDSHMLDRTAAQSHESPTAISPRAGSSHKPILIESTPSPKRELHQRGSRLFSDPAGQHQADVRPRARQTAREDRDKPSTFLQQQRRPSTKYHVKINRDDRCRLLDICSRLEEDYLEQEDDELSPHQSFWKQVMEAYNHKSSEPHFHDWKHVRSDVMKLITKRYNLMLHKRLKPSKDKLRNSKDTWAKVVAHSKFHPNLSRVDELFWNGFDERMKKAMHDVVAEWLGSRNVLTMEDHKKLMAHLKQRVQAAVAEDREKINNDIKAKRREKKLAKRRAR